MCLLSRCCHEAIQCPSNNPSQGKTKEKCDEIEEVVYEPPLECLYFDEEEESNEEIESLSETSLLPIESTNESSHTDEAIVSCVSTQPLSSETLCEDSSVRAIVPVDQACDETSDELEDCVNDLFKDAMVMIEPKVVLHPQSYLSSGAESTSLLIEEESLNPL